MGSLVRFLRGHVIIAVCACGGGTQPTSADVTDNGSSDDTLPAQQIHFQRHGIATGFAGAISVSAADLDADGDLDVVAAAFQGDRLVWSENDGSGDFSERVLISGNARNSCLKISDLDGDGDIVAAVSGSNALVWLENDGSGVFDTHVVGSGFVGSHWTHAIDMDADGDVDVLGAASDINTVAWWENSYR